MGAIVLAGAAATSCAPKVEAATPAPTPIAVENQQVNVDGVNGGLFLLGFLALTAGLGAYRIRETIELNKIANRPDGDRIIEEQIERTIFRS